LSFFGDKQPKKISASGLEKDDNDKDLIDKEIEML